MTAVTIHQASPEFFANATIKPDDDLRMVAKSAPEALGDPFRLADRADIDSPLSERHIA